jgi:nitroimidazol reductase NimA-like FMN-containing flavoprotein (pyridoxamine 5'-phosphate oxidase superfamily)
VKADDPIDAAAAPASDRVRLRRRPKRGHYDRATIDAILDAALVAHVAWIRDGQPYSTPTTVWRTGDRLYWHGSPASQMIRATRDGAPVCVSAAIVDAMVLARAAANHSVNFRSVMVMGTAHAVEGEAETAQALEALIEHLHPGRWAELRPITSKEIRGTTVLWMDLTESSAKIRAERPQDDPGDETWPVWAGLVPIAVTAAAPEPDEHVAPGTVPPPYLPTAGARLEG